MEQMNQCQFLSCNFECKVTPRISTFAKINDLSCLLYSSKFVNIIKSLQRKYRIVWSRKELQDFHSRALESGLVASEYEGQVSESGKDLTLVRVAETVSSKLRRVW